MRCFVAAVILLIAPCASKAHNTTITTDCTAVKYTIVVDQDSFDFKTKKANDNQDTKLKEISDIISDLLRASRESNAKLLDSLIKKTLLGS